MPEAAASAGGQARPEGIAPWIWAAAGGGLVLLMVLIGLARRRRHPLEIVPDIAREEREEPNYPASSQPAEAPAEPKRAEPKRDEPAAAPTADPIAAPRTIRPQPSPAAPDVPRASGELGFDPMSLRISLVYATMRLHLSLRAATPFPPAVVRGDMIGAHGSLSMDEQLAPSPDYLHEIGKIGPLKEGETVSFDFDLQLPLAAIRPVREGQAEFFVPLVRLAFVKDESHPEAAAGYPHIELGCVFTVGQAGSGGALTPFRVDTGPRDFMTLEAREVATARRTSLFQG